MARPRSARPALTQEFVAELLEQVAGAGDARQQQFIREVLVSVARLARDNASVGDVKLINTALKEMRYAFKVFAPYRHVRKVSTFGSARTPEDAAEYQQAREFARRICAAGFMLLTGAGGGIMRACQGAPDARAASASTSGSRGSSRRTSSSTATRS
jgi:hypothetical protein